MALYIWLGIMTVLILLKPICWLCILLAVRLIQSHQSSDEAEAEIEVSEAELTDMPQKVENRPSPMWKDKFNVSKYYFFEGLKRYLSVKIGWWPSQWMRLWVYKHVFLMKLEADVVIYGRTEIWDPHKIRMGKGSIVSDRTFLDGRFGIDIGKNVNMGLGVRIFTNQHDVNSPSFDTKGKRGKVVIGDRVWISAGSIILPKVTVGEGAVIAAGSVVTKDVEPFSIYGGIPAKKIGSRNRELTYELDGNHLWFI